MKSWPSAAAPPPAPAEFALRRAHLARGGLAASAALVLVSACGPKPNPAAVRIGDPDRGKRVMIRVGCGSCHVIPGVQNADGKVGPPLSGIAGRTFIAGMLPNTPPNLVRWIQNPQSIVPGNAMPNMELNDHDSRDVAAYLETLR